MLDGRITNFPSKTVTFNAPGLSQSISPSKNPLIETYKIRVAEKMTYDKFYEYNSIIVNLRIKWDPISKFGDDIGKVIAYSARDSNGKYVLNYHKLIRFTEISY